MSKLCIINKEIKLKDIGKDTFKMSLYETLSCWGFKVICFALRKMMLVVAIDNKINERIYTFNNCWMSSQRISPATKAKNNPWRPIFLYTSEVNNKPNALITAKLRSVTENGNRQMKTL